MTSVEEIKKLGNDAFTAKQYREALRLYSEALKLDSHNAALYSNKSACYASLQLWDESAKEARQSVSIDPNFIKAYGRLATAEIELGQYDAALTTLRTALSKDPDNESLKSVFKTAQTKKRFWETLFGDDLLTKTGLKKTTEALQGKKRIAIYFSAHWCPPCRGFTPMLVDLYKEAKALGDNEFEVVFCSSDHDNSSFNGYFSDMPWTAVPFANDRVRASLSSAYHVQGIPSLIVLDRSGHVIDGDGRSTVSSLQDAGACMRRWSK